MLGHRRGETNLTQGTVFGLGGFVGTTVGVLASAHVAPWVQTGSFALLLLVVATVMLRRSRPEGDDDTSGPPPLVAFSPVRFARGSDAALVSWRHTCPRSAQR